MKRRTFLGGLAAGAFYRDFLSAARAQGTSAAPKLKIREIRAVRLRNNLNNRFVRVYTDQGLTGTGEFMDTLGAEYIINNSFSRALPAATRWISRAFSSACGRTGYPAALPAQCSCAAPAAPSSPL